MFDEALARELEERVSGFGYDLVELEQAGSKSRPVMRVRIDRPGAEPGKGVSVDDCARVSRLLEAFLDGDERLSGRYVLEVSSPGVERPLVRPADYERFAGREIAVLGRVPIAGRGRRIEGELVGIESSGEDDVVRVRLKDGEIVEVRRSDIARAHLVFHWP